MGRLSSLGILPGEMVRVSQKFPAFVIELEETQVAMEREVVENMFVRNGKPQENEPKYRNTEEKSFLVKLKERLSRTTGQS
ncbi:MAG: FeoA family protein [Candidatus Bipolaricaulota bacterium]